MLFVRHELSYDEWMPNAERIYRYENELVDLTGGSIHLAISPPAAKDALLSRFSEIEAATRFRINEHSLHMSNAIYYEWVTFVDQNFFEVLDIPLLKGDKQTALSGLNSVLVSEQMAVKYFGDQDPLGKIVSIEAGNGGEVRDFSVTGVFRDIPQNSHLELRFLVSKQGDEDAFDFTENDNWHNYLTYTYLKLKQGSDPALLEAGFAAMLDDHVDPSRWGDGHVGSDFIRPYLIAVQDIHLDTRFTDPMRPLGDRGLIIALLAIAVLILVIASINFMNLALARSFSRAREVSLRKVHGAGRRDLMIQYLGETMILTLVALGVALMTVSAALPYVNAFTGKTLALLSLMTPDLLIPLIGLLCFVAVLAGFYPALVLSSFRPAVIFRGSGGKSSKGRRLRSILMVFQFTVSIALGIGATVIQSQRDFTANHDLGFSVTDKLVIRYMNWGHFAEKSHAINDRIQALPQVVGTSYSNAVPGDPQFGSLPMSVVGQDNAVPVQGRPMNVDEGFFQVYGVELLAGRFLSRSFGEDVLLEDDEDEAEDEGRVYRFSTVINESAVKQLGYSSAQAAIGTTLDVGRDNLEPVVVGVVSDFHFSSLREEIIPTTYYMENDGYSNLTIRFRQGTDIPQLVNDVTAVWQSFIPLDPISLEYLDQNVAAHYENDRQRGVMVSSLALLALFIACLGLYGLSALTAVEKSREVSIRKVHGSSVAVMLSAGTTRMHMPDGTAQDMESKVGDAMWADAGEHLPENMNDKPLEVVLIELKD